ncbi:unnamed protein product [Clonostachys rhizophaga]|uniref:Zn(2)-C6 fungal-type domain-containing protein n=1 Tax=Clonostachys rhizophaga TaxID=160324 RepID=A0A9N9VIX9_9HYPO|nr:unnamed protein product [Clonostachys rhizophaga]
MLPTAKRGKKSKACDRCSQSKVSCDLELPCSRCRAGSMPCSYSRAETDATAIQHSVTKVTADEIPWLLKMTNPSAVAGGEDGAARDIFADHDQFDAFWTLPIPQASDEEHSTPSTEEDFFGHGLAAWIADSDGDHPDFNFDDFMDIEHDASLVSPIVLSRMDEMVSNLSITHERMRLLDVIDQDAIFDTNLAQMVFTASNLQYFVWLYFQRVHRYHPILHPPSFDCETSSLPLVMSVFLFGSLFSAPFDSAISARSFFDVAEEYIFSHPDLRQILRPVGNYTSHASSTKSIEILQAALTIGMIQNSRNDQATRRRMRIERYPVFTSAVRLSGAFEARHRREVAANTALTWDDFVHDELRVRLSHWTQLNSNFIVGCFNGHTQAYMCEMTGDMPCRTALFEAETSDVFKYQVSLEPGGPRPQSLAGSISLLLQDSWPGPDDESYRRVTPEILALIISSLGVVGVVARTNCLFPLSYRALLRAFMRWKSLWDAKMKESEATGRQVGFSKHAMEMWWLCVAVVKAQQSGDKSKYISNMAIDSFNSVNEFLTRYITTLSSHEGSA